MPAKNSSSDISSNVDIRHSLSVFSFSPAETEVILHLLKNKTATSTQFRTCAGLNRLGPQLYNVLKRMTNAGWIEETEDKPKIYSLAESNNLQKKLDEIILVTQNRMTEQKNCYYNLVSILKTSGKVSTFAESGKIKGKSKAKIDDQILIEHPFVEISEKFPSFIRTFASAFYAKKYWQIIKSEPNMGMVLNSENVTFKLSSIEWKTDETATAGYCGICFYEVENNEKRDQLMKRIHIYTLETLTFNYKMEKKGFHEKRQRKINDFSIVPTESNDPLGGIIHIDFEFGKRDGLVQTLLLPKDNWLYSVWAENVSVFDQIIEFIKNYAWDL
jgi:sugar-specific transcriptional regulator TrmB